MRKILLNKKYIALLLFFSVFLSACSVRKEITSLSDLPGATLGVLTGSAQDHYARYHFSESQIIRIDEVSDLLAQLEYNKCDAVFLPKEFTYQITESFDSLHCITEGLPRYPLGAVFRKEDIGLKKEFDSLLEELTDVEAISMLENRWEKHPDQSQLTPLLYQNADSTLVMGISGTTPCFSFIRKGEIVGFDIELAHRFVNRKGYALRVEIMPFGSLIPALLEKRVDFIINSVLITEERAKQVLFSDPYLYTQSAILSKKIQ